VTLGEIGKIKKACPGMELEYFVHGAMCVSYSGRCLLSRWMRDRSANLGDCAQPCRWKYKIKNYGVPLSGTNNLSLANSREICVEEDEHGTYLLNSKDLCLIQHLDKLAKAGINSFKIEGRTKSVYYVSAAVKAYRQALNAVNAKKNKKDLKKIVMKAKNELEKLANRGYSTGFLLGKDDWENNAENSHGKNEWQFAGEVVGGKENINKVHPVELRQSRIRLAGFSRVKVHNVLKAGDVVEIITPQEIFRDKVKEIWDSDGKKAQSAHGGSKNSYSVRFKNNYKPLSLLRKRLRKF
jgi:putative protease